MPTNSIQSGTPARQNRGLDAFVPGIQKENENTPPEMGIGEQVSIPSQTSQPDETLPSEMKAAAKMIEVAGKLSTEALQMENPEEPAEDQRVSTVLQGEASQLQQQQQTLNLQRQEQERLQKMVEEQKKRQEEIDRRNRLRLAAAKEDSIAKTIVKDQLNPLDVGLLSTPFGLAWFIPKIVKGIGKILP